MLDALRASLHRAMTTETLDGLAPVRVSKDLARRANRLLGAPLASREDLEARRKAREKLSSLRSAPRAEEKAPRADAPVMIYFEANRNARGLARIEELLAAKSYAYQKLDVTGDEATLDYVMHKAGCKADDLPVVFVAGEVIGTYEQLVASDVSGAFERAVRGEPSKPGRAS